MPSGAELKQLRRAAAIKGREPDRPDGVITNPRATRGYSYAVWERMMSKLCGEGLFRPYVHGGYEITAAGRAAIPAD